MINFNSRFDLGRLFVAAMLCMLVCCDSNGGCAAGGTCTHPWDGLPGSCAMVPARPVGTIGGACHADLSGELCDLGARCDDNVCIPCGTAGGTCCDPAVVPGNDIGGCTDGSTCTQGGDFGICDATCGTLTAGKDSCCAGNSCGAGEMCLINTGKCVASTAGLCADPTLPGTKITFLDANKCTTSTITLHAASSSELNSCIASIQTAQGWTSCTPGDVSVPDNFCGSSNQWPDPGGYIANICTTESAADVETCKKATCFGCTLTADNTCT